MADRRCAKVRYRDRIAAMLALAKVDDHHRPKAEARAYRCRWCHGWHLTSERRRRA